MHSLSVQAPTSPYPISFEKYFRVTVGYSLSATVPRCELRSEVPVPLENTFRMDCTVKKSNLTIDMAWERITPTGTKTYLNYDFVLKSSDYDAN